MAGFKIIRPLRIAIAATIAAASFLALGTAPARAASDGPFIACGYADTPNAPSVLSIGNGCTSLDTALSNAFIASNELASAVQVQLMPGLYCPITLPQFSRDITIIGVGWSGVDTSGGPSTYSGPEAGLSSFEWNSAACDPQSQGAPSYAFQTPDHGSQIFGGIRLENLTIDGSGADGYSNGLEIVSAGLSLYDVLVQDLTGTGLTYTYNFPEGYGNLDAENSAFVNNAVGLNVSSGSSNSGIDGSTIADNVTGLLLSGDGDLISDTISHNNTGINVGSDQGQLVNSIVGGNTTDCAGSPDELESEGAGNNLESNSCAPTSGSQPDIILAGSIGPVADNGGPTPSILPPMQAVGTGEFGACGGSLTKVDQRDFLENGPGCDIGSVNTTDATGTPAPEAGSSSLDFGTIPVNQPADSPVTASVSVDNGPGGDVLGVTGVAVTGDNAFSLSYNGCQYAYLTHEESRSSCTVSVLAAPTTQSDTPVTGTLTIDTTGGPPLTVSLSAVGGAAVPPPGPPTNVHGTTGSHHVNLVWTAPADDGGQPIEQYDVRYSATGGAPWTTGPTTSDTSTTISSLTDGASYVFEVAADNDYAVGDYSDPSIALTPHAPADPSALTGIEAKTIDYGKPVTLTTTLTDATTHAPIAGAAVRLKIGNSNGPGTVYTTNSQGIATATIHPTANAGYLWAFGGITGHGAVSTPSTQVLVAQVVHASLSKRSVKHGKATKVFGTVSPTDAGKTVTIERLVSGKWKQLGTAKVKRQTLPNGKKQVGFVLTYKPAHKGGESLRVSCAATSSNAGGVSKPLTLKVT